MSRPRVIRRVIKMGRDGNPKAAHDSKTGVFIERVTALVQHKCGNPNCEWLRIIMPATQYALVTDANRRRRMGRKMIPEAQPYHFECVPPNARRLVRFFEGFKR